MQSQGIDRLASSARMDIPIVRDIPVVSQLAKEKKLEEDQMKIKKVKSTQEKMNQIMEEDE